MTHLVLDCNYLCHRAFHAFRHLEHDGVDTGAMYGFFNDVINLQEEFATKRISFCFDGGLGIRREIYPEYKMNRVPKNESEIEGRKILRKQIEKLPCHLHKMGFRNVFKQKSYEADDIIAAICENSSEKCVIVSADSDLFQLLKENVTQWNPRTKVMTTWTSFTAEWGIDPTQWVTAKAIAGDTSDNIVGIRGVGLKTAAKFIRCEPTKLQEKIESELAGIIGRNHKLIALPFAGTEVPEFQKDKTSKKKWNKVVQKLGMKSLVMIKGIR